MNLGEVLISMVYLGIKRDKVKDAEAILSVFPFTHYAFAPSAAHIKEKCLELAPNLKLQVASGASILIKVDGKDKIVALGDVLFTTTYTQEFEIPSARLLSQHIVEQSDQIQLIEVRKQLSFNQSLLKQLETQLLSGISILTPLLQVETKLNQVNQSLQKQSRLGGTELKQTRESLNMLLRHKNVLQQQAAQQVHAQDLQDARYRLSTQQTLVMKLQDKFDINIAKQITRNRAHKQEYQMKTSVIRDEKNNDAEFVTIVTFADGKVKTYSTGKVPSAIADDEEIDFITTDEWKQVYEDGDCKSQCILILNKPNIESNFHSPSSIHVQSTGCQISLNTVYNNIAQQVQVQGYDSIFSTPFTGYPSNVLYNAVLPT